MTKILNRDAIAHRLQQDVTITRGRHYKQVAEKLVEQGIPDHSDVPVREFNPASTLTVLFNKLCRRRNDF